MSVEHPNILYVGDLEQGRALLAEVEPMGWYVYLPEDTMEALGMYITYYPDIVLLDSAARPVMAAEVYHHARTVIEDRAPLIVLGAGDYPDGDGRVHVLPHNLPRAMLVEALRRIADPGATLHRFPAGAPDGA